jgi:hypothetical protein
MSPQGLLVQPASGGAAASSLQSFGGSPLQASAQQQHHLQRPCLGLHLPTSGLHHAATANHKKRPRKRHAGLPFNRHADAAVWSRRDAVETTAALLKGNPTVWT